MDGDQRTGGWVIWGGGCGDAVQGFAIIGIEVWEHGLWWWTKRFQWCMEICWDLGIPGNGGGGWAVICDLGRAVRREAARKELWTVANIVGVCESSQTPAQPNPAQPKPPNPNISTPDPSHSHPQTHKHRIPTNSIPGMYELPKANFRALRKC